MSPPVAPAHGREYSTPRSPGNITCAWIVPLPPLTSAQANEVAGAGFDSEAITTFLILRPGHISIPLIRPPANRAKHAPEEHGVHREQRIPVEQPKQAESVWPWSPCAPWSARGDRPHRCPSARDRVTLDREGPRRQPAWPATRERQARPVAAPASEA